MRPQVEEIEDDLAAEEENKLINEKNAPYLYDIVITHALDWPSLTCQWFPDKESSANKPYTTHRLLLGTHTSGQAQDYLQIASVQIPKRTNISGAEKLDRANYDDERGELGGGGVCKPDIRLVGQTREGYGLAWNPVKAGNVLGASEDMTVCHWDVNSYSKAKTSIEPTNIFRGHTSVVGDVDWHPTKENVFASVGDDKMLMIWDTRAPTEASTKIQAHDREILAVSFNPGIEHLVVTGSADKTVILHDMRAPNKKLHTFESHTDEVLHLSWSPHNATIFASASSDRRINIWDLSMIGVEQTPDDQEDGPPELLFIHGVLQCFTEPETFKGHTARPTDFCWAPGESENWTATSTSEDNIVMVWQPTMRVWAGDAVKVGEEELEADAMEGVEATVSGSGQDKGKGKQSESGGSLSMSVSVSGDD
ncbi:histone acetyltransferase type B subunit 2 [Favolaschia claudopus]|uniref:Histone acetyltransferase type B subunit 2 n=1 Tax=Favolaschia claudopus TaxID=2862362 RepID=A0AAW0EH35_9AGAR